MLCVVLRTCILACNIKRKLCLFTHNNKIRTCCVKSVCTKASSENYRNLRNRTRNRSSAVKNLTAACKKLIALHKSAAYTVIETYNRSACFKCKIINLFKLCSLCLTHSTAANVAVLCESVNRHTLNCTKACNNLCKTFAGLCKSINFSKAVCIKKFCYCFISRSRCDFSLCLIDFFNTHLKHPPIQCIEYADK